MAVNNRTEVVSAVNTSIQATVTNPIHRDLLNNQILTSALLRKDVIASATPVAGNVTANFANTDLITITTSTNLTISFSGLENGDTAKYLYITKQNTNSINFTGATDVSARKRYINTSVSIVVYRVSNKNGNIYVESINVDNQLPLETGDFEPKLNSLIGNLVISSSESKYARYGNMINATVYFSKGSGDISSGTSMLNFASSQFTPTIYQYVIIGTKDADSAYLADFEAGTLKARCLIPQNREYAFTMTYMIQ